MAEHSNYSCKDVWTVINPSAVQTAASKATMARGGVYRFTRDLLDRGVQKAWKWCAKVAEDLALS